METETSSTEAKPKVFRIVVVEDNPGDVYLLKEALRHHHIEYDLICHRDGEQALEALNVEECVVPDLIILDLQMPRKGGFDLLTSIRSRPRLSAVPVAILTSSDSPRDRHRGALLGADRYILKSSTLGEFMDKVGQAIEDMLDKH